MTMNCFSVSLIVIYIECCEELTYYVYCYKQYQRCSDSKWQFWHEVFLTHKNIDATHLDFSPCHEYYNCYLKLLPYFWDNSTLEKYLNNCTFEEATEIKGMLLSAKSNKEQHSMFAYKEIGTKIFGQKD